MNSSVESQYQLREADKYADQAAILSIWRSSLNHPFPKEKYQWLYTDNNPAGDSFIGVLTEKKSAEVVGVSCLASREFSWQGEPMRVGNLADFAVDQAHRTLGPALALTHYVVQQGLERFPIIYGFPNRKAQPVLQRAGCMKLGSFVRYARVINTHSYLGKIRWLVASRFIAGVLNFGMQLFESLRRLWLAPVVAGLEKEFSEDFDQLFENSTAKSYLCSRRTATVLNWRHVQDKEIRDKKIFTIRSLQGELQGYIVYHCDEDTNMVIDDFLASDDTKYLNALWANFICHARKSQSRSINLSFMGNRKIIEQLENNWFKAREERLVICAFRASTNDMITKAQAWYLTASDEDG